MATDTKSALHTPLCDLLGIRYPICQAGMGWVARSALAAAVSEAGGLGVIAAAHGSPEYLREEIRRVRDATDRPFGVDVLFATIRAAGDEVEQFTDQVKGWIDVTLEERVPVLIAGLGNPGPVTAEAHRLGIKVMALCGNVKQARDHAANGVDAVIAQGHEAGGHTGRIGAWCSCPRRWTRWRRRRCSPRAASPTAAASSPRSRWRGRRVDGHALHRDPRGVRARQLQEAHRRHRRGGHVVHRVPPASPAAPSGTTSRASGRSAPRRSCRFPSGPARGLSRGDPGARGRRRRQWPRRLRPERRLIGEIISARELIDRVVTEAEATLSRLCAR